VERFEQRLRTFLTEFAAFTGSTVDTNRIVTDVVHRLETMIDLMVCADEHQAQRIGAPLADDPARWGTAVAWATLHRLGLMVATDDIAGQSRSLIDEYLLGRALQAALVEFGYSDDIAADAVQLVKILTTQQRWHATFAEEYRTLASTLMSDGDVQSFTRVNRFQGVLWFNKERFERLLRWLDLIAVATLQAEATPDADAIRADCAQTIERLIDAAEQSGYRVEQLLAVSQSEESLTDTGAE